MKAASLIKPSDELFHQPLPDEPTWLETNWFSFLVPQVQAVCHIYAAFRMNVGAVYSSVMIYSRDCLGPIDFDYFDSQIHLPLPTGNLDHYRLANSLEVQIIEPLTKYRVTYQGYGGMSFDLTLDAMMPALDSRETVAEGGMDFSHFHQMSDAARASVGHIDQTMMVRGTLVLAGRTFDVAAPANRDHSWSPRPEYGHGRGNFDEAFFGDDLVFHFQTSNPDMSSGRVTNGYLIENGQLLKLKGGELRLNMEPRRIERLEYDIEDELGRSHRIVGRPKNNAPASTFPNQYNLAGFTEWECGQRTGFGEYKWHWDVRQLQQPFATT